MADKALAALQGAGINTEGMSGKQPKKDMMFF